MDDAAIRKALVRHWEFEGLDYDKSHEIYHDDAVLEFPQSGERFIGRQNFLTWRKKYPAKLDFKIRRCFFEPLSYPNAQTCARLFCMCVALPS